MTQQQGIIAARAPLYDRAHLASFTGGDIVLERGLVRDYCHNARDYLAAMHAANTQKRWREVAHKLKGASRGIGCWQIAVLCETAERMDIADETGRDHVLGQIGRLLDDLAAAMA
ncbi:MAG: hypothetical protein Tsb0016_09480 [Sphingomonadales bacterium]